MAKLHQRIEQIFKFRLLSNGDIKTYLEKMSRMGKIDEVKKNELFTLILTKLGEIEDSEPVSNLEINKITFLPGPDLTEEARKQAIKDKRIENLKKARTAKQANAVK